MSGGPLQDRVAVVTGATGALGGVVAAQLADAGARLVLAGRDRTRLELVAAELGLPADRSIVVAGELTADGAADLARAAEAAYGAVDIVIHLVGGYAGGAPLADVDPAELTSMIEQHVWTTFHLARTFAGSLAQGRRGRFITVSSPFGFNPPGKNAAYAAAKAAQQSLVLSLAQEFRGTGATSNALLVRTIDGARERVSSPSSANARWTTPEEIASAILWLSGDGAGQVNGVSLPLYGWPSSG